MAGAVRERQGWLSLFDLRTDRFLRCHAILNLVGAPTLHLVAGPARGAPPVRPPIVLQQCGRVFGEPRTSALATSAAPPAHRLVCALETACDVVILRGRSPDDAAGWADALAAARRRAGGGDEAGKAAALRPVAALAEHRTFFTPMLFAQLFGNGDRGAHCERGGAPAPPSLLEIRARRRSVTAGSPAPAANPPMNGATPGHQPPGGSPSGSQFSPVRSARLSGWAGSPAFESASGSTAAFHDALGGSSLSSLWRSSAAPAGGRRTLEVRDAGLQVALPDPERAMALAQLEVLRAEAVAVRQAQQEMALALADERARRTTALNEVAAMEAALAAAGGRVTALTAALAESRAALREATGAVPGAEPAGGLDEPVVDAAVVQAEAAARVAAAEAAAAWAEERDALQRRAAEAEVSAAEWRDRSEALEAELRRAAADRAEADRAEAEAELWGEVQRRRVEFEAALAAREAEHEEQREALRGQVAALVAALESMHEDN